MARDSQERAVALVAAIRNHDYSLLSGADAQFAENVVLSRDKRGCWLWTGSRMPEGYGMFKGGSAYRWLWLRLNGPLEPGIDLHHTCGIELCVNPSHLEPLPHREHMSLGKHRGPARRRLAPVPERLERARAEAGLAQDELATLVGCSPQAISSYETGARVPRAKMLRRIATALNREVVYFLPEEATRV